MFAFCRRLFREEAGATSVEYAVVLACLLMVIIASVLAFGGQTGTLWGNTHQSLTGAGLGQ